MAEEASFRVTIPCDDNGYVLQRCPKCGEHFKLKPSDIQDDSVLDIRCPSCSLVSGSFLTEDVVELALAKAANWAMGMVHESFGDLERSSKGKTVEFKAGKPPEDEFEPPLYSPIEAFLESSCPFCGMTVMVSPLLKMSVYTCPFCGMGVINEC